MATPKSNPRSAPKRAPRKAAPKRAPANGKGGGLAASLEDELLGPATAAQLAEEERLGRKIPRVRALTTEDLGELQPPHRQRYPVHTLRKVKELWRARELLYTFVERDIRVRYKQAVLGAFWAIAQPLFLMVVFSVVFGRIANISTDGVEPYAIFSYTALVPFQLFASSLNYGTSSIVSNWATIRKIALPREVFPLASVASAGFDFLVSSVILLGMLIVFGYYPRVTWLAYPVLLVVLLIITTAVTLLASMTTAYVRDTRYGIPLMIQVLMFATPVAYPLSKAQEALPSWLADSYAYLNPLVPVLDGFRSVLAKGEWPQWGPLGVAAGVGLIGLLLIYRWYKRLDPNFADVV
jgi:ABC-type polysaccharide/polyol phosphate export permease